METLSDLGKSQRTKIVNEAYKLVRKALDRKAGTPDPLGIFVRVVTKLKREVPELLLAVMEMRMRDVVTRPRRRRRRNKGENKNGDGSLTYRSDVYILIYIL